MHAPIEKAAMPIAEKPKRRTITLTNRAPISIIEDDWNIIAEGRWAEDERGETFDIEVRVRRHKKQLWRYIVHGNFFFPFGNDETFWEGGRVGHEFSTRSGSELQDRLKLWEQINKVGEELRERIHYEKLRKRVTDAVDQCFAKLPAVEDASGQQGLPNPQSHIPHT